MPPPVSVLDQSPVRRGGAPADAVRETLALAQVADRLGDHRSWLAEAFELPRREPRRPGA